MNLSDFALLLTVLTAGLLSPGPDMLLVLRNSFAGRSRRAGLATAAGICSGLALHLCWCVAGLGWVVTEFPETLVVLRWAGGLYLAWLGVKILRASARTPVTAPVSGEEKISSEGDAERGVTLGGAFRDGLLCNLLNGKVVLFLLGLFTQFVRPEEGVGARLLVAVIFLAHASLVWGALVVLLARPAARGWLRRREIPLNRAFAVLLLFFAVRLVLEA